MDFCQAIIVYFNVIHYVVLKCAYLSYLSVYLYAVHYFILRSCCRLHMYCINYRTFFGTKCLFAINYQNLIKNSLNYDGKCRFCHNNFRLKKPCCSISIYSSDNCGTCFFDKKREQTIKISTILLPYVCNNSHKGFINKTILNQH